MIGKRSRIRCVKQPFSIVQVFDADTNADYVNRHGSKVYADQLQQASLRMRYFCFLLLLCLLVEPVAARETGDFFDKPLSKNVVVLPPDAEFPYGETTVNCYYYDKFMVKEVDRKEKGADKLSVMPIDSARMPSCNRTDSDEIVVKEWSGYFAGVKNRYVFFASDDGYNGAMNYGVFDGQTGAQLFTFQVEMGRANPPFGKTVHSIAFSNNALTILYRRAYLGECSLYDGGARCWNSLKRKLDFSNGTPPPDCLQAYKAEQKRTPKYASTVMKVPTVIGYEVKLIYASGKVSMINQPGTLSCWLTD